MNDLMGFIGFVGWGLFMWDYVSLKKRVDYLEKQADSPQAQEPK